MKTIYVANFMGETDDLFYDIHSHRDEIARPFIYLREGIEEAGFEFKLTQTGANLSDAAAFLNLCNINPTLLANSRSIPRERRLFCITEPVIVMPQLFDPKLADYFGTIFTYFDAQVDEKTYFKLYHLQAYEKRIEEIPSFEKKKFCTMIQTNHAAPDHPLEIYSERQRIARLFPTLGEFDLYGRGWEGYSAWKGYIFNKSSLLRNYKFCIAYENMRDNPGHISDRIFDCLYNGCVPIYRGAPNIVDWVPKECFIDRKEFLSNEDLHRFLQEIDEKSYNRYLEAAAAYLASPQAETYRPKTFSRVILNKLIPIAKGGY